MTLDPDRLMNGCNWRNCDQPATEGPSMFCAVHYGPVFDSTMQDAQLIMERLRLEQRWCHWVYLVPWGEDLKVGYSAEPSKRLERHRADGHDVSKAVVVRGSREVEAEIHAALKPLATDTPEIFTDDNLIWDLFAELKEAGDSTWAREQAIARYRYMEIPAPP